jgi:hypothetical protein
MRFRPLALALSLSLRARTGRGRPPLARSTAPTRLTIYSLLPFRSLYRVIQSFDSIAALSTACVGGARANNQFADYCSTKLNLFCFCFFRSTRPQCCRSLLLPFRLLFLAHLSFVRFILFALVSCVFGLCSTFAAEEHAHTTSGFGHSTLLICFFFFLPITAPSRTRFTRCRTTFH